MTVGGRLSDVKNELGEGPVFDDSYSAELYLVRYYRPKISAGISGRHTETAS